MWRSITVGYVEYQSLVAGERWPLRTVYPLRLMSGDAAVVTKLCYIEELTRGEIWEDLGCAHFCRERR